MVNVPRGVATTLGLATVSLAPEMVTGAPHAPPAGRETAWSGYTSPKPLDFTSANRATALPAPSTAMRAVAPSLVDDTLVGAAHAPRRAGSGKCASADPIEQR